MTFSVCFVSFFLFLNHTSRLRLTVCRRPLQDIRGTYKLHLPGGLEGGLLLAEPGGRPPLHADSPDLLPQLLPDRPAPPRPADRRPRPVHRRASAGHPAHDCPGGVEEQTYRGGFIGAGFLIGVVNTFELLTGKEMRVWIKEDCVQLMHLYSLS